MLIRDQAWKQARLDIAELMYSQLAPCLSEADDNGQDTPEPATIEGLVDLLFELGRDLWHKKDFVNAVAWLERAYDALALRELDAMSLDAAELRCSIMHYLGTLEG